MNKFDKVERPWGDYITIYESDHYKIKVLTIKKGHRTSLQSHEHRDEFWTVVSGLGTVTLGEETHDTGILAHAHVPPKCKHRIAASKDMDLVLVEVQVSLISICEENDIIRYEDDYNRV